MKSVRLFKPSVGESELAAIRAVFDRSWLGLGPTVTEFEQAWSEYVGLPSVGVNSGTAALHLALGAFRFPAGKKVLVPALTFVASATAALYNQLDVVFVDIDPVTLQMDVEDLERKADSDCVAIVVVHFGGLTPDLQAILDLAKRKHLKVIEDCAHCAGGEFGRRKLGTWGDVGCFSFEEKKSMTTGDGGMITSADEALISTVRKTRWLGIDKDTWQRSGSYTDGSDTMHWYYEISDVGYKYNMNDLAAAIGIVQLKKLDAMNQARRDAITRYLRRLPQSVEPLFPYRLTGVESYWLFGVRVDNRPDFIRHMKSRGVATGVHYQPITQHPLFKNTPSHVPVSDSAWQRLVSLPLFADITEDEIDYVVECVAEFARQ